MSVRYNLIKSVCGVGCIALAVLGAGLVENAWSSVCRELDKPVVEPEVTAKTLMVVMDPEFIREGDASPSESIDYKVTHYIRDVEYGNPGVVTWDWGPLPGYSPWPPGSTPLTARIWAWKTSDGGKTYDGIGWDYILNSTMYKHRGHDVPSWVGSMISSLCDTNATCNARERTNIDFYPGYTVPYNDGNGEELISLTITPQDVGVFYQNETQQFKAVGVTPDGTVVDLTQKVDWYVDPEECQYKSTDQDTTEGAIATIDQNGLATVHSTWGRVVVKASYPKGAVLGSPVHPGVNSLLLRGN